MLADAKPFDEADFEAPPLDEAELPRLADELLRDDEDPFDAPLLVLEFPLDEEDPLIEERFPPEDEESLLNPVELRFVADLEAPPFDELLEDVPFDDDFFVALRPAPFDAKLRRPDDPELPREEEDLDEELLPEALFLPAIFLEATFDEPPRPEDDLEVALLDVPPLEEEPFLEALLLLPPRLAPFELDDLDAPLDEAPRPEDDFEELFLEAPFLEALFEELRPEDLLAPFFAAAFFVAFAMLMGFK
ncbi:MAG: hypothetical protein M3Y85_07885 [Bacteroidota bacterium]|nr:hypothetical protein [Bacteroidota bacterium]